MDSIFLPADFKIETADQVVPFIQILLSSNISSGEEFQSWLLKRSELESAVSEDMAWRYIRMTCNTEDEFLKNNYLKFVNDIQPVLSPLFNQLNEKMLAHSSFASDSDVALQLFLKKAHNEVALFCDKNIPLQAQCQELAQSYSAISGALSIEHDGKTLTLQQASLFLKQTNREIRKEVYEKIQTCRFNAKNEINEIFLKLRELRHEMAINAGFANFRDFMFKSLNRFDYEPEDCFAFHDAIAKHFVPLATKLHKKRRKALLINQLKPYDLEVDLFGRPALKPFENADQLLAKTTDCLYEIDTYFGDTLTTLKKLGHLDLESRSGKAPGGYNYPLMKTGVPFIFMNASGSLRDVETLIHEAGHAVHNLLTNDLPLAAYKETPAEVAELASMSMELLSRKAWKHIFPEKEDETRALHEQLEDIILTLPWIATIDRFQHEIYTTGVKESKEINQLWLKTLDDFSTGVIDFEGYSHFVDNSWHRQLHIFEVPFYYVEYGFAQLGALAIWKRYMTEGNVALEDYKNALKAGQTNTIPEIYKLAGIKFDFSENYVAAIAEFIANQLDLD